MLVLHIDIDFFVDPIVYYRTDAGPRPSGREFRAEKWESVRTFLEKQCLLSPKKKLPGAAVIHNDEVFGELEKVIANGSLSTPFEMIHVDAHADLGVGEYDRSFERISTDILHLPVEKRAPAIRSGFGALGFGNWLAFCLACRWIDRLTVVRHPEAKDDLQPGYFVEYLQPKWQSRPEVRDLNIRMQPLSRSEFESGAFRLTGRWGKKLAQPVEPPLIPTTVVERAAFQLDRPPDFLFLCLSPGYSPPSIDKIFERLKKYL
jgi:hypothetical protein